MPTFDEIVTADIKGTFLNEHAQDVVYTDNLGVTSAIKAQLFFTEGDGLDSIIEYCWCASVDVPLLSEGDTFEIDGVSYGVISFISDEHNDSFNIYLNKV